MLVAMGMDDISLKWFHSLLVECSEEVLKSYCSLSPHSELSGAPLHSVLSLLVFSLDTVLFRM